MNHKIKTDIGYCVVSDDCALDEEELKTLAADIKKQPKLTQPNFFIDMRYDYKFIQLQALLKITELLQPVIQGNIKNETRWRSYFPSPLSAYCDIITKNYGPL